jgi:POT family proton-dependent oligopeptide transporter
VLQLEKMDRRWRFYFWNGTWESSQIQAVNGLLILVFIPVFSYVIYPALNRITPMTPLKKIAIGMFLTAITFCVSAWIESRLEPLDAVAATTAAERNISVDDIVAEQVQAGQRVHYGWQILAYVILTCAEVMVSITCLEFSYTQAPNRMKSLIMSLYLLSISLGNVLASAVNEFIQKPDGTTWLPGASYYWFFTALMLVASVGFLVVVATFRERTYIQESV